MDLNLDELERLHAAATPGEWAVEETDYEIRVYWRDHRGRDGGDIWTDDHARTEDAQLIAALRNAAPTLIAAARAVAEAREIIAFYADPTNYFLTGDPFGTKELWEWAPNVCGDDGERARAWLARHPAEAEA